MSDGNMALWESVEKTDPAHVKPISGKSYKGNSPKPYYLIRKATETFGPVGIGWGFNIVEEKLLDGALIEAGFYEKIHTARVRVWYKWNGERGEIEHVGQTTFCGRRKDRDNGQPGAPFTDEDAPKKSVTDALVKALSMLGFAGDIFIGRYDDSRYVNDLRRELDEERREERAAKSPTPPVAEPVSADDPEASAIGRERIKRALIGLANQADAIKFLRQNNYHTIYASLTDDDKDNVDIEVKALKKRMRMDDDMLLAG